MTWPAASSAELKGQLAPQDWPQDGMADEPHLADDSVDAMNKRTAFAQREMRQTGSRFGRRRSTRRAKHRPTTPSEGPPAGKTSSPSSDVPPRTEHSRWRWAPMSAPWVPPPVGPRRRPRNLQAEIRSQTLCVWLRRLLVQTSPCSSLPHKDGSTRAGVFVRGLEGFRKSSSLSSSLPHCVGACTAIAATSLPTAPMSTDTPEQRSPQKRRRVHGTQRLWRRSAVFGVRPVRKA